LRKKPVQQRSQRTVGYILDAAAYILAKDGLKGFTTNRIAERAGVNISSLYQYFPDKMAILEALQRRHMDGGGADPSSSLARLRALPLKQMLRELVDLAFETHAANIQMHRVFLRELPQSTRDRLENDALLERFLSIFDGKVRTSGDRDQLYFIARSCLLAIVHGCVCEKPGWLKSPAMREEVVCLLYRFFK
jgi:AcrR family transcriptional regulator